MALSFFKMKYTIKKYRKYSIISVFTDYFTFQFSNFGASLIGLKYKDTELVLSPKNLDDILEKDYFYGKTIGAIANRVENGIVIIDDKKYRMGLNEGANSHHGGSNGISNKLFDYSINEETNEIVFIYNKTNLEDGLPGNIEYKITYKTGDKLLITFEAKSDKNTIISLTNHSFFCLNDKDVGTFVLKANCNQYVEVNPSDLLPLRVNKVPYYMDFRKGLSLGKYMDIEQLQSSKVKGYDHDLIFGKGSENPIVLEDSKFKLTIKTDFPSFQIYSDNYENKYEFKDVHLKKCSALAIEPCDILTNRKLLKANEIYKRYIEYSIKEK